MPHGVCYTWDPRLIWLHVLADGFIALAYFIIPGVLAYVLAKRADMPFRATVTWFAIFIVACGTTHLLEIVSIWRPVYWVTGTVKAVTAGVSMGVAIAVIRMLPLFMKAPTPENYRRLNEELDQLVKERTAELTAANEKLSREVEQRRAAEGHAEELNAELAHRLTELEALIDLLPVGVALATDVECLHLRHNKAFTDLFELPDRKDQLEEPVERTLLDKIEFFKAGGPLAPRDRPMQRSVRTGESVHDFELEVLLPSKTLRTLTISSEPLKDANATTRGCVATFQDITNRKKEEKDLRLVIEAAPNAMIIVNRAGVIQMANSEAHRLFAFPDGALLGTPVDNLLPDALRTAHQKLRDNYTAAPKKRDMGAGRELFGQRLDGKQVPLEIGLNPIRLSSGPAVLASIIDLTERKKSEEERLNFERSMHETQKLESLGILAGGIAHDFNNLLTGVLGHASMLRALGPESEDDLNESIDHIESSSRKAADLCKQLMAYAGRGKFQQVPLALSDLVRETGKLLDVSVGKVARLEYSLKDDIPTVVGDPTQLQQVLMNLVINASEAVEQKIGTIKIATDLVDATETYLASLELKQELKPGKYVTLSIQDNGSGMDAETVAKIFDPFFTTKFTGRGLGLAAVQGIVKSHKGGVRIYSEPGRGTAFKILFPASAQTVEASKSTGPTTRKSTAETGEVLIIDDEETVRKFTSNALKRTGFNVTEASGGNEGLGLVRNDPKRFRFVMVDLTMPEMDGDEVMERLKEIAPDLPVILMSGFNEQETIQRLAHRQPNAFLSKPFTMDELAEKVHLVLYPANGDSSQPEQ